MTAPAAWGQQGDPAEPGGGRVVPVSNPYVPGGTTGEEGGLDHIDCCDGVIPILDPVDLATGSFWLHETDLARPGRAGLDFFVTRHYHSGNVLNGPLGKRWDSPLFMRVVTEAGATPATFYNGRMRAG